MSSGKPLGDGIYWENNNRDDRNSIASPSTNRRTSMSPQRN